MEDNKTENTPQYSLRSKKSTYKKNTEDNLSYVDDLFSVIITQGFLSPTAYENIVQEHQERRKSTYNNNNLELDKEKSWRLDIGKKGRKEFREPQKNLGIHLDWNLDFKLHVKSRIEKAEKVYYRLKPLFTQN